MPPTPLREQFTTRLKEARLAMGISRREPGRRIGLPEEVVSSRVTCYEQGTSEPDFATASMRHAEQRRLAAELKERTKWSSSAEQAESDSESRSA